MHMQKMRRNFISSNTSCHKCNFHPAVEKCHQKVGSASSTPTEQVSNTPASKVSSTTKKQQPKAQASREVRPSLVGYRTAKHKQVNLRRFKINVNRLVQHGASQQELDVLVQNAMKLHLSEDRCKAIIAKAKGITQEPVTNKPVANASSSHAASKTPTTPVAPMKRNKTRSPESVALFPESPKKVTFNMEPQIFDFDPTPEVNIEQVSVASQNPAPTMEDALQREQVSVASQNPAPTVEENHHDVSEFVEVDLRDDVTQVGDTVEHAAPTTNPETDSGRSWMSDFVGNSAAVATAMIISGVAITAAAVLLGPVTAVAVATICIGAAATYAYKHTGGK